MTNNRPIYILPWVNYNVYWPIIGHFYCMSSFFIRLYKLLLPTKPNATPLDFVYWNIRQNVVNVLHKQSPSLVCISL